MKTIEVENLSKRYFLGDAMATSLHDWVGLFVERRGRSAIEIGDAGGEVLLQLEGAQLAEPIAFVEELKGLAHDLAGGAVTACEETAPHDGIEVGCERDVHGQLGFRGRWRW